MAGLPRPCVLMPKTPGPSSGTVKAPIVATTWEPVKQSRSRWAALTYLHYDGAGPRGWLACLATSKDLRHWDLKGPVLDLGSKGEDDSGTASSPWTIFDGKRGTCSMSELRSPRRLPTAFPPSLITRSPRRRPAPAGPWTKRKGFQPFRTQPGSYCADTASPGQIINYGGEYLMFFSAAAGRPLKRTLSIARTKDLDGHWAVDRDPILPPEEQVRKFGPVLRTRE